MVRSGRTCVFQSAMVYRLRTIATLRALVCTQDVNLGIHDQVPWSACYLDAGFQTMRRQDSRTLLHPERVTQSPAETPWRHTEANLGNRSKLAAPFIRAGWLLHAGISLALCIRCGPFGLAILRVSKGFGSMTNFPRIRRIRSLSACDDPENHMSNCPSSPVRKSLMEMVDWRSG